jgi:hypothetical protein
MAPFKWRNKIIPGIHTYISGIRWEGQVAHMGAIRNAYSFWSENVKGIATQET